LIANIKNTALRRTLIIVAVVPLMTIGSLVVATEAVVEFFKDACSDIVGAWHGR
jgi:hypothetical protein